jgi:hypothetical protein
MAKSKKPAASIEGAVALALDTSLESKVANIANARDAGVAWHGVTQGRIAIAHRMAKVVSGFPDNMSRKAEDEFRAGWYLAFDVSHPAPRYIRDGGKYLPMKESDKEPEGATIVRLTAAFVTAYDKKQYADAATFHNIIMGMRKRFQTDSADQLRDIRNLYKSERKTKGKGKGGKATAMAVKVPSTLAALIKSVTTATDKRGDTSLPRDTALGILNKALSDITALTKK